MKLLIVGTGLIGTSVGLAVGEQMDVLLDDSSAAHLERAVARGAGRRWDAREPADLALVCAPPAATASVAAGLVVRKVAATVSQVASAQSRLQADIETLLGGRTSRVCGGHPVAGRERSGPDAATGRLFLDRPWVVCPSPSTAPEAAAAVVSLAEVCGAVPVTASAEEHDAAVALVSHLPQLAASALAAQLLRVAPAGALDPIVLAGPGVQDTTRVAASDPNLWVDVLTRNAAQVAPLLRALTADLAAVGGALDAVAASADPDDPDPRAVALLRDLLEQGRSGRSRLPLKRGTPLAVAEVVVSVPDTPGQLAGLLAAAAAAEVNVEDMRVEHLPGRPRGLVELLVPVADAGRAREALSSAGYEVLPGA